MSGPHSTRIVNATVWTGHRLPDGRVETTDALLMRGGHPQPDTGAVAHRQPRRHAPVLLDQVSSYNVKDADVPGPTTPSVAASGIR